MSRCCRVCETDLDEEPAILVEGKCYCFFHAKQVYPRMVEKQQEQERTLNADYPAKAADYEARRNKHLQILKEHEQKRHLYSLQHGLSKPLKWAIWLVGVIVCWSISATHGFFSMLGMLVFVWMCEAQTQEAKRREFDAQFAKPQFTESPPQYIKAPLSEQKTTTSTVTFPPGDRRWSAVP